VSFDPDPAAAAMVPVSFDPTGVGVGWFDVGAGNPDVAVAVPTVIAGVPGPVTMLSWGRRNDFVRAFRRSDTDDHLSLCYTGREEKSTNSGAEEFVHLVHRAISLCY
jgi:hypothetical protein